MEFTRVDEIIKDAFAGPLPRVESPHSSEPAQGRVEENIEPQRVARQSGGNDIGRESAGINEGPQLPSVEPSRKAPYNKRRKYAVGATLAPLVLTTMFAGGILAGKHVFDTVQNLPSNTQERPDTGKNSDAVLPPAPANQAPFPTASPLPPPKDYNLSFIGFGKKNNGYRELGQYGTKALKLNFQANGHTFTLSVPDSQVYLLTGGEHIQTIPQNNGVDTATNTVKKKVLINQDSMDFQADLPASISDSMKFSTLLPAERVNSGYDICSTKLKIVGCPGVPIPSSYYLSKQQVATYKSAAEVLILQATQKSCAAVEFGIEKQAIDASFDQQAKKQGVTPSKNLITPEIVDNQSRPVKRTPNYTRDLITQIMKQGGIANQKALDGLFEDKPEFSAVCKPMELKKTN